MTGPHRRQFVIGPACFQRYEDWVCRPLRGSTWISHCPDLHACWISDADGVHWVLLGLAIETLADRPDPALAIARARTGDVPELSTSWAGRWLLAGGGHVYMDASGLLGCFHARDADGATWASSSPALLANIIGARVHIRADGRRLRYGPGIPWFPPPRSRFTGIARLLPSQVLSFDDGAIQPRRLLPSIDPVPAYDETVVELSKALVTTLRRLARYAGRPWLGLTAGHDSRIMLAVAHAAGVPVRPFTRIAARMSVADRLLPPALAAELGFEHVFLRAPVRQRDRREILDEHCAGHVSTGDAEPFFSGTRAELEGVAFGGHGVEVASVMKRLRSLPDHYDDPVTGAQQLARGLGEPPHSSATAALRDWLEWVTRHPEPGLDWRDRFFIEQRQAGWLSSKEQLYDLSGPLRFPLINCARNHALMLGIARPQRLGTAFRIELILSNAPALLRYPINPADSDFGLLTALRVGSRLDPLYAARRCARAIRSAAHLRR